ncbi:unnamed protein product [Penicillium glandicola]
MSDVNAWWVGGSLLLGIWAIVVLFSPDPLAQYPLINSKRSGELFYTQSKIRFIAQARSLLKEGLSKTNNAFRLVTNNRILLVLHSKYRNELRDHKSLNNTKPPEDDFFGWLQGFEPFNHEKTNPKVFAAMVRTKLTPSIGAVGIPLSEETDFVLRQQLTDSSEWHQINVKETSLQLVARLSARIFLGPQVCRNPAWIGIMINYTVEAFMTVERLRMWPRWLLWLVHWFLPSCKKLRSQVQEARSIISQVLQQREQNRKSAFVEMEAGDEVNTVQWLEDCAKGLYYDPALLQMGLAVVATHTSADLLSQVIFDLCEHPELLQPLREEIVMVITQHGWSKNAIHNLKLLDSVLKESQRLKPMQIVSLYRYVTADITLSDGTLIPKGTYIAMIDDHSLDPNSSYTNGDQYDGYRFINMREVPERAHQTQLVSVSSDHTGFGFGNHACPGRFFAAAELKIALCHLLLKYDLKLGDQKPQAMTYGFGLSSDPFTQISVRRRQEEISLADGKS